MAAHTKKAKNGQPLVKRVVRLMDSGRQTRALFSAEKSYYFAGANVNMRDMRAVKIVPDMEAVCHWSAGVLAGRVINKMGRNKSRRYL